MGEGRGASILLPQHGHRHDHHEARGEGGQVLPQVPGPGPEAHPGKEDTRERERDFPYLRRGGEIKSETISILLCKFVPCCFLGRKNLARIFHLVGIGVYRIL